jgi:hexosaminidase
MSETKRLPLVPYPRLVELTGSHYELPRLGSISSAQADLTGEAQWFQAALADTDLSYEWTLNRPDAEIVLEFDEHLPEQGYHLDIITTGIKVTGRDHAGIFYGLCTLRQMIAGLPTGLPCAHIEDSPDYIQRGFMLDISRDRVPTLETLFRLIDDLASLKMNQLQLYIEHTFAYAGHEIVWKDADPLTAEEIEKLDAYCRARHIELVPNQNSLGHMERWLKHAPYRHLAELADGFITNEGTWREPTTVAPIDESFELIRDLYDQLLPHFSSRRLNVGCDEPWELGQGRSKTIDPNTGAVYFSWLKRLYEDLTRRGYEMMFWGDIIIHHPEFIPQLPRDIIVMEWGYEASHPFDKHCQRYAEAGIPFYVCPGSSSWNALVGRVTNAVGNIRAAAYQGLVHGALGCLITDWGDNGHWQPLIAAYPGIVYTAAVTWGYEQNQALDLAAALNLVLEDEAGVIGEIIVDLGNVYQYTGPEHVNGQLLAYALQWPKKHLPERLKGLEQWGGEAADYSPATLRVTAAAIDAITDRLKDVQLKRSDGALITAEWAHASTVLKHGAKWMLLAQEEPDYAAGDLLAELDALIARQRQLWLSRSRQGGVEDSIQRFDVLRQEYLDLRAHESSSVDSTG